MFITWYILFYISESIKYCSWNNYYVNKFSAVTTALDDEKVGQNVFESSDLGVDDYR